MSNIIEEARKIAEKNIVRRNTTMQRIESDNATVQYMDDARNVQKVAKVEIEGYKTLKVTPDKLFAGRLTEMSAILGSARKDNPDSIEAARNTVAAIRGYIKNMVVMNIPFVIDELDCKIEQMRRSLASDIAGVVYGSVTDKILIVDHNVVNYFYAQASLLGNTPKEGYQILDNLQKNIIYALQVCGITIGEKRYDVWAATSSQQKTGAFYCGEHEMMVRTFDARMYGVELAELNGAGGDTGAEYLKRQALLFTPSTPAMGPDGETIRLRDAIMMGDVVIDRIVSDALLVNDKNATVQHVKDHVFQNMTMGDGEGYILVDWLTSCQIRGLGIKAFAVLCTGMIQYIEQKWGIKAPEEIKDFDGTMRKLAKAKMILTKSCWKGSKLGLSWAEFVDRAEKLAVKYPMIDCIRIVRYSDSTEDSRRMLTRQSVQQWYNATDEQIVKLTRNSVSRLKMAKTLTGATVKYAGLDREDRTEANRLFEDCPEILCSDKLQDVLYENWNKDLCEAASGRVTVSGLYPYIAMDPVAMLEILIFGMKPTRRGLGVLKEDEINVPLTGEQEKIYFVRYPNNYMMGQVLYNHNDHVFDNVGEVAILSFYGFAIVKSDGDFDGDEGATIKTKVVIELMEQVIAVLGQPVIDFPHDTNKEKFLVQCEADYHKPVALALWRGQKYNNVGRYSNLATKIMQAAALATSEKTRNDLLMDAVIAHVGTILVIDMIKTGEMPAAIEKKLNKLNKQFSDMPWNQRFNKSHGSGWMAEEWDEKLLSETDYICDKLARTVLDGAGEYSFDKQGVEFDLDKLLSGRSDLPEYASKGVIDNKKLKMIRAMNYIGDDRKILVDIQNSERISPKELMKFFWKNSRTLARKMAESKSQDDRVMMNEYQEMVRDIMINMGDGRTWKKLSEDDRRVAVVDYFIRDAFTNNELDGSYTLFVLNVFAHDVRENVQVNTTDMDTELTID